MRPLIVLLPCLFLVLFLPAQGQAAPRRVVAYLPEYRVATLAPTGLSGVTDLVFFSLEPTPVGGLDSARWTPAIAAKLKEFRRQHSSLRLWAALGGWDRSAGFAPVATDPAKRGQFVSALTLFCLREHLNGADFDWEHPAGPAEEAGYAALLADTRRAFAPHHLQLSVTIAPWQKLAPSAVAAVDFVNLMSYDHDGRHSTFAQAEADVDGLVRGGIPPIKICLGIPFYGRSITKRDTALSYADIVSQYHPATNVDEVNGLYFNGPETVAQKTRYALRRRLGGVMIWEIGQDAPGERSLLKVIQKAEKAEQ